jgi:hypothetical protein
MRACQHKALERFIAQHGADWKGLLLGLWKTGNGVQYLSLQEILSDDQLTDEYFLVSLRRTHGATWLRGASDEDPIGHMAWLRARQSRPKRAWQRALERWRRDED